MRQLDLQILDSIHAGRVMCQLNCETQTRNQIAKARTHSTSTQLANVGPNDQIRTVPARFGKANGLWNDSGEFTIRRLVNQFRGQSDCPGRHSDPGCPQNDLPFIVEYLNRRHRETSSASRCRSMPMIGRAENGAQRGITCAAVGRGLSMTCRMEPSRTPFAEPEPTSQPS